MSGVILLLLPLSVLVVFVFAAMAFSEVAFRGVEVSSGHCPGSHRLRSNADAIANRALFPAQELTVTLQRLTGKTPDAAEHSACVCETYVPSVTDPEARTIAEELRQRGGDDLTRVLERSRQHGSSCPMLTETGLCACAIARPLSCIGRCVLGGDSPEWVAGLGDTVQDAFRHHLESRRVNSETHRLDDALVSLLDRPNGNVL